MARALLAHSAHTIRAPIDLAAPRFWKSVDIRGKHECWPFKLSAGKNGYGQFSDIDPKSGKPRKRRAHRVAYELTHGPIPAGVLVLHSDLCGTDKTCCNPGHLRGGRHIENVADAMRAGRMTGRKLDAIKACEIIRLSRFGSPQAEIADTYGVTIQSINRVVNGTTYGASTAHLRDRAHWRKAA